MKRPLFLFAIFLAILIITFRLFVKEDMFYPGHISHILSETPSHLSIKGTVSSDPFYRYLYFRKAQVFVVTPALVRSSGIWQPVYGDIRVTSYNEKEVKYGDEILFEANLKIPFSPTRAKGKSSFDYKRYLSRLGIYSLATISGKDALIIMGRAKGSALKSFAYNLKGAFKHNIDSLFKRPERYFLSAVLLGERQDIPKEWRDIFAKTQTMHLLAISGLHVGIIAFITLFFIGLFGIPRQLRYSATICVLILYAIMVGGRPSVVRATIMGTTFLGAYLFKRDADIYNSLGLAAAVILLYNPDQLFAYGFILSFISVFFIVYMTPQINRALRIEKIKRTTSQGRGAYYILTLFSASLAVWLGLLPLTINFFNIVSPVSVVANMIAIPSLFAVIALSVFAMAVNLIFPFLGAIFAEGAVFFIDILISSMSAFSKLPFAHFEIEAQNIFTVLFYYALLFGIVEYRKKR